MNEQDLENLRELHAGFALAGLLMKGVDVNLAPHMAYELADAMQEARLAPSGIASIKKRLKKKDKSDEKK